MCLIIRTAAQVSDVVHGPHVKVVWDTCQIYKVKRILKSNYNNGFLKKYQNL